MSDEIPLPGMAEFPDWIAAYPRRYYIHEPSGLETIALLRLLPFGPASAMKYVLMREIGDPVENLTRSIWFLTDSLNAGVSYLLTEKMRKTAMPFYKAEPHATVQALIGALYLPAGGRRAYSILGSEPRLDVARDLVEALLHEYRGENSE